MIEENLPQIELKQIEEKKEPPPPFPASQLSTGPLSVVSKQSASSAQPLQKQLQKMSVQPSNLFKQEMLDKLIDTFNKPIVKKPNHLDKNGQSKMAKFIKQHGWKWPLLQLNSLAKSKAQWAVFEGVNRNGWGFLQSGVYYGEKLDGKRHGYGIVYSTDGLFRNPHLFECQWNMDFPTYGRLIIIQDQNWEKYEGTMNRFFNLNGQCSRHDENGYKYEGGWSNGCKDGQGKEIQSDGISGYEGSWWNNQRHGKGRETFPDGGYREGEWESGTSLGEHKYYNKQGELLKSVYFEREVIF
ncbi:hypothetical protein FGO68_gene3334 [Halteria grandinella]|uniref:MORN repeat protein n=1 Tax=Halteria grandinella TaxID=5974 RepID=A0A8J8NW74_HALGN|nr:hypothetical protein FGO68_gene3334 [Halteria grandinella]